MLAGTTKPGGLRHELELELEDTQEEAARAYDTAAPRRKFTSRLEPLDKPANFKTSGWTASATRWEKAAG